MEYFNLAAAVANDIQVVFSALAWAGDSARGTALSGFQRATHGLLPAGRLLLAGRHGWLGWPRLLAWLVGWAWLPSWPCWPGCCGLAHYAYFTLLYIPYFT